MDSGWKYDLEEYIRQGEPKQAQRSAAWKIFSKVPNYQFQSAIIALWGSWLC